MKKLFISISFFLIILLITIGCQKQKDTSITLKNQLKIVECKFAQGKIKPENVTDIFYFRSNRVWILYGISGFTRMNLKDPDEAKKKEEIWIRQDLRITHEDGTIVLIQPKIIILRDKIKKGAPKIILDNNFTFPEDAKTGKYTITLLITDIFTLNTVREDYIISYSN